MGRPGAGVDGCREAHLKRRSLSSINEAPVLPARVNSMCRGSRPPTQGAHARSFTECSSALCCPSRAGCTAPVLKLDRISAVQNTPVVGKLTKLYHKSCPSCAAGKQHQQPQQATACDGRGPALGPTAHPACRLRGVSCRVWWRLRLLLACWLGTRPTRIKQPLVSQYP